MHDVNFAFLLSPLIWLQDAMGREIARDLIICVSSKL